MIVTARIPLFPLRIAVLEARVAWDDPIALGPAPGEAQVVGECTPAAWAQGVRPGLRVGEAMARCPELDLVVPHPDAARVAADRMSARLEDLGAAVQPMDGGMWSFMAGGLMRLHGGLDPLMRRARAALPVGCDGRVGAAPTPFASCEAARHGVVIGAHEVAGFLSPLPATRLPLPPRTHRLLSSLGIRTIGHLAALPHASVLDALGRDGQRAWRMARGEDEPRLQPRVPPEPLGEHMDFPDSLGALPALEAAMRMLITRACDRVIARGRSARSVVLRARLEDGGSWTSSVALREATADAGRIGLACIPRLSGIGAPVSHLAIEVDAGGPADAGQMTLVARPDDERRRRAAAALDQVRAAEGDATVMRLVEIEPWSRLPERRWALGPYEA
ncbi:MAG: DNA polymerase Y family protein [Actinobacteria bacterium]|nr:DNA polymerase Y family protein [Actinomycetota bacterium]